MTKEQFIEITTKVLDNNWNTNMTKSGSLRLANDLYAALEKAEPPVEPKKE